ncbi:MAG: PKD domain-containing protein [Candidatus Bipolaricaulia bacterium]
MKHGFGRAQLVLSLGALALLLGAFTGAPVHAQGPATAEPSITMDVEVYPESQSRVREPITFRAATSISGISDEAIDEVRTTWDLGDGTVVVGEEAVHRYITPGTYDILVTVEVFESGGRFHRASETREVTVAPAGINDFSTVVVIDLDGGFALFGELVPLRDFGGLRAMESDGRIADSVDVFPWFADERFDRFVLSGGAGSIGELWLTSASLGHELNGQGLLGLIGVGVNLRPTTVSLTNLYPAIGSAGHDVSAVVTRAFHLSAGLYQEASSYIYVGAEFGLLSTHGQYEGSGRVTIGGNTLPLAFDEIVPTVALGIGVRVRHVLIRVRLLFAI